jgi:hypothetical protein
MVKKNQYLTYWRVVAVIAALAWMLVLVNFLYTLSTYETSAEGLFHPYVTIGLQGATIIACAALVIFPLQFWIYAAFCCLWGLIHIIEGGSFGGILMYGLGLLFLFKEGFFRAQGTVKLSFAALVLAGAILSQIRYGAERLTKTLLDTLAVFLITMIGVLLYSQEIQKQVSSQDGDEDMASSQDDHEDMASSQDGDGDMASSQDDHEDMASSRDGDGDMASSQDDHEDMASSQDDHKDMASSQDDHKDMASSQDGDGDIASSQDDHEDMASSQDGDEDMASSQDDHKDIASSQDVHKDMIMSDEQERMLLLHRTRFNRRDIALLRSVLAGEKYESIAQDQGISLSSVKKRVRFLYDHLNLPDRASFMNNYEGYAIELGMPVPKGEAPKSETPSNIRQFPSPQSSGE